MSVNTGLLADEWAGAGEAAPRRAWRAAHRHSRVVKVLRIVLPLIAFVVATWMFVSARKLPSEIGNIDLGEVGLEGTTLTMKNPSLSGFNENGTSYQVSAVKALQDVTNPRIVTLQFVDGTMTKPDGSTVRVTSDNGVFDSDARQLELSSNIVVVTESGDRAYLESAHVDMDAGRITSEEAVRADAKSGRIRANAMEISDRGAHLLFRGDVVVELRLDGGPLDDGLRKGKRANEK